MLNALEIYASEGYDRTQKHLATVSGMDSMEAVLGYDLVSGVRKAKQRGEARTSYGLKRTIDKLSRYYNGLFAITQVDLMQMIGVWYLDGYYDFHIPLLPILTFVGAIFIGFIEVKSIYEKADDKVKNQSRQVLEMMGYIAGHKDKPEDIAKAVAEYLEKENKV